MKIRHGFVSNSSSMSFIITNTTKSKKTIADFVKENPQLIEQFCEQYAWHKGDSRYTQDKLLESAEAVNLDLKPGKNFCIFGDEQGTLIGEVFDYILRDGGKSASFKWRFKEALR